MKYLSGLAFTNTDLLAAVLVLAFGLALVIPAIAQVKNDSVEKRCADHLRQIGQAIQLYANENRGAYPRAVADREDKDVRRYTNPMAADPFGQDGPGANDVTAALFLLLRTQSIKPDVFICPATDLKPWDLQTLEAGAGDKSATKPAEPAAPSTRRFSPRAAPRPQGVIGRSNFPSRKHLSYSYQNPYPSMDAIGKGFKLNATISAEFVAAADMNPGDPILPKLTSVAADEQIKRGNSFNHKQEGQNALFGDGRVEWVRTPFCGVQEDNIFTYGDSGEKAGGLGNSGSPVGPRDSVLLPTALDEPSPQPAPRAPRD